MIMESQNDGTVWVGRDLTDHLVQLPCHGQGHLPLDQVPQSSIQPSLEHRQGGGSHSFSGQCLLLMLTDYINDSNVVWQADEKLPAIVHLEILTRPNYSNGTLLQLSIKASNGHGGLLGESSSCD